MTHVTDWNGPFFLECVVVGVGVVLVIAFAAWLLRCVR